MSHDADRPRARRDAFTLIELLVVVAIIAALLAMLMPSMGRAVEISRRAACGSNLRQVHVGSLNYAAGNRGQLIPCNGRAVQIAFARHNASGAHRWRASDAETDWIDALATVQLVQGEPVDVGGRLRRLPSKVWNCPSRDFQSGWEPAATGYDGLIIAYQYFGGIETWQTLDGDVDSRSPVTAAATRPGWLLTADTTMRVDYAWGGGRSTAYGNMPSHPGAGIELDGILDAYRAGAPAGGNQGYFDGSVAWMPFRDMVRLHTWVGASHTRQAYGWQDDWGGYSPPPSPFY